MDRKYTYILSEQNILEIVNVIDGFFGAVEPLHDQAHN